MRARQRLHVGAVLTAIVLGLLVASPAFAALNETDLVSRQSLAAGGLAGNDWSRTASMSADGRYVAFTSQADNLSPDDENAHANVFVRDMVTGVTTLVSRVSGVAGAGADDDSTDPVISADGQIVAFTSEADNLDLTAWNMFSNVFVRDLRTNVTALVSRRSIGDTGFPATGSSTADDISADGRFVVFTSEADDLSPVDTDGTVDVFVHDRHTSVTSLISRRSDADGGGGADAHSDDGTISADGRYVAFTSAADNLSAAAHPATNDIYLRDTIALTTTLVSRRSAADGGAGADAGAFLPSISADGRYVAFESGATNLADGPAWVQDVFVRDTVAESTTLASRQSVTGGGAPGDADSMDPAISADGRYVAFESDAVNLAPEAPASTDVLVRDLVSGVTRLVDCQSAADGGLPADASAWNADVSADGRYVTFESSAPNLTTLDVGGTDDVFRRDVLGGPAPPPPPATTAPPGPPAPAPATTAASSAPRAIPGLARDTVAPRITALSLTNRTFAVAPLAARNARGTRVRFTLSERADVRFGAERATAGRSIRGRCVKPTRANRGRRRCTRWVAVGSLVQRGRQAGANIVAFSGRIGSKALRAGRHRLVLTATDAAGNRSQPRTLAFRIVSRSRR